MIELIEFETERLRLRQWRATDRQPFAALNADPTVMEFFPSLLDRSASDTFADRIDAHLAKNGWGLWSAELGATGEFIGYVGLAPPRPELPFSPGVEIGWRLAAQFWGHGYATEAAKGALRVGFESLELPEIVSFTTVGNSLRQHCLYRLSRDEWAKSTQA